MNYYTAKDLYDRSRDKSKGYKYGNNRRVVSVHYLSGKTAFGIQLHETVVVAFTSDRHVVLDTGGWYSRTTKQTMNQALSEHGIRIFSDKGDWYVDISTRIIPFENNMEIRLDPIRLYLVG